MLQELPSRQTNISLLGCDPKVEGAGAADRLVVTAAIEPRLLEKTMDILTGEGLIEKQGSTKQGPLRARLQCDRASLVP